MCRSKAPIFRGTLKTASGGAIDVGAGGAVFDGSAPASPIANSGNVSVLDSSTLLLLGRIDNSGSVTLASTGDQTFMSIGDGGAALTGGGKIILTSNGEDGIESGGVGSPTLTNVNNTISGNGVLGDGLNVINEADGVIDANLHSFPTAFLSIADADVANAGLIEATAGGFLEIDLSPIDNASTGIVAATGTNSVVLVEHGTITGGTLKTASGGVIKVGAGDVTFDGSTPAAPITNTGNVVVEDNSNLTLLGTIDNTGSITLDATANTTELIVGAGGATLEGGGKVILTTAVDNEIASVASSDTLTNVNNTITGLGVIAAALVNEANGVVDATAANGDMIITGGTSNAGLLELTTGGLLFEGPTTVNNTATGVIAAIGAHASVGS